ncbi:mobilization protein MbpA [Formosa sp. PL04]|uniref:mobilization protein MbpA n=1 Tax=Formosa sp. PL04 TaxID=3081755 RepID=UPI0029828FDE|nr:mobilization protein MbpA [Formosa sp. PL04]MDW5290929.1 mobilization protein MbpA [Formosa sp. PL04]
MKRTLIRFRCSVYEKKFLNAKAKHAGISLSAFCRRTLMEKELTERMTEDHIMIYKMLVTYHNNFKRIGNMYRVGNPKLEEEVLVVAREIQSHLKKITS